MTDADPPPSPAPDLEAARARRGEGLARMRTIANATLAGMAVLYLLAAFGRRGVPGLGWLQAFAEAGLAGGLADWFAVTALFRRPLGLPIPHTALIPKNRRRIGAALGEFIGVQLLTPNIIDQALTRFDAAALLPDVWRAVPEEALRAEAGRWVRAAANAAPAAPAAGAALARLWTPERSARLFGLAVEALSRLIADHRDELREAIVARGGGWTPKFVDRMLADRILGAAGDLLAAAAEPDHPWRVELDLAVTGFAARLEADEGLTRTGERWKADLLTDETVEALARLLADRLRAVTLTEDQATSVNAAIRAALKSRILATRPRIAELVTARLAEWDEAALVRELELQTGRDLQYIRINGALAGGLVGVAIYAVSGWLNLR
jgi:uncharacterized membrane-anchored protein YjiN (DUF445 family)